MAREVEAHAEAAQQLGLLHLARLALEQPQAGDVGEPDLAVAREHARGDAVELAVESVGIDAALVGDAVVVGVLDQAHDFAFDGEVLGLLAEDLADAGRRGPRWCARRGRARACPCSHGCRARWCGSDRSPRRTTVPSRRSRWPRGWRAWARRPTATPSGPVGNEKRLIASCASSDAGSTTGVGRRWTCSSCRVCEATVVMPAKKNTAMRANRTEGFMISRMSMEGFQRRTISGWRASDCGAPEMECIRSEFSRRGIPQDAHGQSRSRHRHRRRCWRRTAGESPNAQCHQTQPDRNPLQTRAAAGAAFDFYLLALTAHAAFCADGHETWVNAARCATGRW